MDAAKIADRLRTLGGIARAAQLGASRSALVRAADRGAIERVRKGVYALGAHPDVRDAAAHGGELACAAALRAHGVWVLENAPTLHVWLGPDGRAHPHPSCACIVHRDAGAAAFGIVSIVRALVQVAACLGAESFFAAFESAWRLGLIDRADRAQVRRSLPARFRWLVDLARPDADSGLESLLRLRLRLLGIALDCQVLIRGIGVVDFLVDGRLIIEVDGRLNHDGASLRHKDLVRDAEAAAQGYETLRFDYALVVHDWPRVRRAITATLSRMRITSLQ
jgi:very-short-patch-repair endonuclease